MSYSDFIQSKAIEDVPTGIDSPGEINAKLFEYQSDIVRWALRRGRAAIFADCGMGKTAMQLEWARHVMEYTEKSVLILAPLAVATQTVREGEKFGIPSIYLRDGKDAPTDPTVIVANYEMLEKFDVEMFGGVVLDESSILKSYTGKFRNLIIDSFQQTPFRLACTATPAPNDHMELGNHSEFLGVLSRVEMLATFFVHDGGDTSKWRLKGHAENAFWEWVSTWGVSIRRPSDLGYSDDGFTLPPIHYREHIVPVDHSDAPDGQLFRASAVGLSQIRDEQKRTASSRAKTVADIIGQSEEPWIVWCNTNLEADELVKNIPRAVEIRGSDKPEDKERMMRDFTDGRIQILITKPSIAGFGMNWQHCRNVAFVGLSHSYEQFYQAVRRCYRFGQKQDVNCHIIVAETEGTVLDSIKRKDAQAEEMAQQMIFSMAQHTDLGKVIMVGQDEYNRDVRSGNGWTMHLGDCVEVVSEIEKDTIDFTVFSPPFASLYTYSASSRDMGNCRNSDEFADHFKFLVPELYRVTKPGRLLAFHCMNLPTTKSRDGYIGLYDFRGDLIKLFAENGWIYHSEVCIWKDPVTQMQRTKALGLLHKTIKKDSSMSRQGLADYLVVMRKPGQNPDPVTHTDDDLPVEIWQRYASPVWMDINPSDTLQKESAREEKDERHICPLQLGVIERAIHLWTRPGDLVLSPFGGIGSEGYQALKMGRQFIGTELKRSYWQQACANLEAAATPSKQLGLFA